VEGTQSSRRWIKWPIVGGWSGGGGATRLFALAAERPMTDLQRGFQEGFFERMGYRVGGR
jgi:hypothetical protein